MNRDKLIQSKQLWAREGRLLVPREQLGEAKRLPPGQHLVRDWPVLDIGTEPNIMQADWHVTIGGKVNQPVELGWREFSKLPQRDSVSDIHCVTGWSRYDNQWRGVSTGDLLAVVKPSWEARFVILRSFDSYSTTLSIEDFSHSAAILATHWDDKPLTRSHGAPVRLILPHLYLWKSAKWLRHIWFTDKDAPGYWEQRGYHKRGDPWRQQRYGSSS